MFNNLSEDKSKLFKNITIVLSVIIGLVAILIFSGKFPGIESTTTKNTNKPTINIWGSLPDKVFRDALDAYQSEGNKPISINYLSVNKDVLNRRLVEAASQGTGPDIIIADYSDLLNVSSLLYVIPYSYMTELDFKKLFVDATHILATPYGASFYPLLLDPSILIFNKKILSENGFTNPPFFWTELPKYQSKLTTYDSNNKPNQSAFGIGANNTVNRNNVLYTQILQLGAVPSKVIWGGVENGTINISYTTDIGVGDSSYEDSTSDLHKILKFQNAFSNPQKTSFTWSETEKSDFDKFISGKLAIYFGKASDINYIKNSNPNLDIGLYFMPQMENGKYQSVAGDMIGVGVSKNTKDFPYAVEIAQLISGKSFSSKVSFSSGMAGARKDVLYGSDGSERAEVIGRSAIIMKLIYNNNPNAVNAAIYNLYDNILSNRKTIQESIEVFSNDWNIIYNKNQQQY